jgi:hypothetical protein
LTQAVRGGDHQGLERVDGLGAGPHGRLAGDPEHPQHLHHAIASLGQAGRLAGLHGAGGGLGVDRVGLAMAAAGGPVWPVDLHHPLPVAAEETGQFGPVAAGALDSERLDLAQRVSPAQQLGVASGGGRHQCGRQPAAQLVLGAGHVHLFVGVDPDREARRLGVCDGGNRRPSCSTDAGGGWHAPAGRADSTATGLGEQAPDQVTFARSGA